MTAALGPEINRVEEHAKNAAKLQGKGDRTGAFKEWELAAVSATGLGSLGGGMAVGYFRSMLKVYNPKNTEQSETVRKILDYFSTCKPTYASIAVPDLREEVARIENPTPESYASVGDKIGGIKRAFRSGE